MSLKYILHPPYIIYKKYRNTNQEKKMSSKVKYNEVTTKTKKYSVRAKYSNLSSISAIIRAMDKDGFSRWEIHKDTGIRYQHVRNVLVTPLTK